jgi:hypothetical protein
MKIAYFASVLAMTAVAAVACDDNADRVTPRHVAGSAGTASSAGKSGASAGSATGGSSGNGAGNVAGASGAPEGGAAGGDSAGGEPNVAGAGEAGSGGADGTGGDGSVAPAPLELIGAYDDYFGDTVVGSFEITQDAWGSSAVAAYDNAANVVYTQFPADDMYNPNKFAKTVYTDLANDSFYYCMVVFSAATLAEARASTATADASDPENGGCGGTFPWSKATKK